MRRGLLKVGTALIFVLSLSACDSGGSSELLTPKSAQAAFDGYWKKTHSGTPAEQTKLQLDAQTGAAKQITQSIVKGNSNALYYNSNVLVDSSVLVKHQSSYPISFLAVAHTRRAGSAADTKEITLEYYLMTKQDSNAAFLLAMSLVQPPRVSLKADHSLVYDPLSSPTFVTDKSGFAVNVEERGHLIKPSELASKYASEQNKMVSGASNFDPAFGGLVSPYLRTSLSTYTNKGIKAESSFKEVKEAGLGS